MAVRPGRPKTFTAQAIFSDRIEQSEAVARSLAAVESRLRREAFDDEQMRNVLTFYGIGGVGKTELSKHIESWVRHELDDASPWGPPPIATPARTIRWDVHGVSGAVVDVPGMLVAVRAGIASRKRRLPAFDLALAAYWTAVRPGQPLTTSTGNDQTDDVVSVLAAIAQDLGSLNTITALSASAVTALVRLAVDKLSRHRELRRFEGLRDILERCRRLQSGDAAPELAADILWLLTEEIESLAPERRPLAVVFIDHFEKIQSGSVSRAERAINAFVGSLPWVLFVITGRDRIKWDAVRDGLALSGSDFPLLAPDATDEPRQHRLGSLSAEDARALLEERSRREDWFLDDGDRDGILDAVTASANGWPLYIDAVCTVASTRSRDRRRAGGGPLTADDLTGRLADLVRRFYEDFSDDEARIFNAACLLPYFDVTLAAAVAGEGITAGAVERCVARTMVDRTESSAYPYRVHEEIRRVVREVGHAVDGGWAEADWSDAARRCLEEARARHEAATAAAAAAEAAGEPRADRPIVDALVLALSVGMREGVWEDWIGAGVRNAPTVRGLASSLPEPGPAERGTDAGGHVELVRALALPVADSIAPLEALYRAGTAASQSAGLWSAYRLRSAGRREETIDRLEELVGRYPDRAALYRNQVSVTLRGQRRFRDALAYREAHGLGDAERFRQAVDRLHGIYDHTDDASRAYLERQTSARFRFELTTDLLVRRLHRGEDCSAQARDCLDRARELGQPGYQQKCHFVLGTLRVGDEREFESELAEVVRLHEMTGIGSHYVTRLLALRAWLTGDDADARRAHASAAGAGRAADWISCEVVLAELGRPLPDAPPGQWLIPYEEVAANWIRTVDRVVGRA